MTAETDAVREFSVSTIHGEEVRLTAWNFDGPFSAVLGGSMWLHLYETKDEPSLRPDVEDDYSFFGGIALDAEAALRLGLALQVAAEKLHQAGAA
jgi:hypothetical protein